MKPNHLPRAPWTYAEVAAWCRHAELAFDCWVSSSVSLISTDAGAHWELRVQAFVKAEYSYELGALAQACETQPADASFDAPYRLSVLFFKLWSELDELYASRWLATK